MRKLVLFASSLSLAFAGAPAQAAAPLSPSMKQDLQCFVLFAAAAGSEKDEKAMNAAIAGVWYFLGRLDAADPTFDIKKSMLAGLAELQGNPNAEKIGEACDAKLSKRGSEMMSAGQSLQDSGK